MTYSTLTGDLFGEPLTSSQVASLASHSQQPESERAETMNDISFRKCFELFQRSDRVGSSLKTFAACLVSNLDEYSPKLSHHWKAKATRSSRFVFLLQPSKPRTGEIGSGSWLIPTATATPSARNATSQRKPDAKFNSGVTLTDLFAMLPTPNAMDHAPVTEKWGDAAAGKIIQSSTGNPRRTTASGSDFGMKLPVMIAMLPTPHSNASNGQGKHGSGGVNIQTTVGQNTGLRLQPAFVEWMMGFPMNYTSLEAATTGSAA